MWYDEYDEEPLSTLVGKTMKSVVADSGTVTFEAETGEQYRLYHSQDCCESVSIDSIVGKLDDLVGSPILMADESSSTERPNEIPAPEYEPESQTWTFYKFGTLKGYVDIRFLGESNGYYSEGVSFCQLNKKEA